MKKAINAEKYYRIKRKRGSKAGLLFVYSKYGLDRYNVVSYNGYVYSQEPLNVGAERLLSAFYRYTEDHFTTAFRFKTYGQVLWRDASCLK